MYLVDKNTNVLLPRGNSAVNSNKNLPSTQQLGWTTTEHAVNCIRLLALDQIQTANSGHPGIALGAAPTIYTIFAEYLHFNVNDPSWKGRDRFILSAGHGSALLYATLFYFGYFVTIGNLKNFRKIVGNTPGHPTYWSIPGIETTTGPLGQGLSNAVGMALSEKWLRLNIINKSIDNCPSPPIFDNYTYVLASDGDLQEGISYEAMSLAGHHKLDKLILLYDSNHVQLDGPTTDSFTENIRSRAESIGWEYFFVKDGNSVKEISDVIHIARTSLSEKPKLIEIHSQIGFLSPLVNKSAAHGAAFSQKDFEQTRISLGFSNSQIPFKIDYNVLQTLSSCLQKRSITKYENFQHSVDFLFKHDNKRYEQFIHREIICNYKVLLSEKTHDYNVPMASRDFVGQMIDCLSLQNPNFFGGSADLSSSTRIRGANGAFSPVNPSGREIKFGVREAAMTGIVTGINLYGCQYSYGSSFLAFYDNARLATRLSAMMMSGSLFIYSHDSIFLGEDGETHQPIEQLGDLRSVPRLVTWRPFNRREAAAALDFAFDAANEGVVNVLVTSRQKYYQIPSNVSKHYILCGGYVIRYEKLVAAPKIILLASGSEVEIAIRVAHLLENFLIATRVISVPCLTRFLAAENSSYRQDILYKQKPELFVIEAGNCSLWYKLLRFKDDYKNYFGVNDFGISASEQDLREKLHYTVLNIFGMIWKNCHNDKPLSFAYLQKAQVLNENLFSSKPRSLVTSVPEKIIHSSTKSLPRNFLRAFFQRFITVPKKANNAVISPIIKSTTLAEHTEPSPVVDSDSDSKLDPPLQKTSKKLKFSRIFRVLHRKKH